MSKKIFDKTFEDDTILDMDTMDIINSDDIVVDIFGNIRGTFRVIVTFEPDPNYDPYTD